MIEERKFEREQKDSEAQEACFSRQRKRQWQEPFRIPMTTESREEDTSDHSGLPESPQSAETREQPIHSS